MRADQLFRDIEEETAGPGISSVYRRLLPDSPFDLRVEIVRGSGRQRFIIGPTGPVIKRQLPPGMRGLSLSFEPASGGLTIELSDSRLCQLFHALVDDLTSTLSNQREPRDPIGVVIDRLSLWRRLFAENLAEGLTPEAQRGLFCELLFLRGIVLSGLPLGHAVSLWQAPYGATQDFTSEHVAVEVKSRFRAGDTVVRISSESQLDPVGRHLFLIVYALETSEGISLNQLVDSFFDDGTNSVEAKIQFADALVSYGFLDVHRPKYEEARYTATPSAFEVREGFPSIRPDQLNPGIIRVAYDLQLTACLSFAVPAEFITEALRGEVA